MINTTAPDFSLPASNGKEIRLSDLRNSYVILIFYPMNDSPTCNRQLDDFSIDSQAFFEMNTLIFGMNTAPVAKQREYCVRRKLAFPILSDPGGKTAKLYGANLWILPVIRRTVVVVDPEGIICYYRHGKPGHEEIIAAIETRRQELAELNPVG